MSLTCLVFQLRLYIFIKNCIRSTLENAINTIDLGLTAGDRQRPCEEENLDIERRFNRLELKAARVLTMGILPFCLLTIPLSGSSVVVFSSKHLGLSTPFWLMILMVVLREFLQLHLTYIPAVFIIHSREFQAAGWRFCRTKQPRSSTEHKFIWFVHILKCYNLTLLLLYVAYHSGIKHGYTIYYCFLENSRRRKPNHNIHGLGLFSLMYIQRRVSCSTTRVRIKDTPLS